jgi:anthranilate synthase component 1
MILVHDLLSDTETPVSAYWKLAHDEPVSFLLESVTGGEQVGRYSFIGVRPIRHISAKNEVPAGMADPLDLLREVTEGEPPITPEGLPPFSGGAVGMLAYDIVRYFEKLPDSCLDDLDLPDLSFFIVETVVAFDHVKNRCRIIAKADGSEEGYDAATAEIDQIERRLKGTLPALPTGTYPVHDIESNVTQTKFEANVSRMREYIQAGDCFQIVPSQRFKTAVEAHPLTIYRALRSINPSPYMFLLRMGDFDLVGASPEILVSLHAGEARVRPIAGTRWRGKSEAEDDALAAQLLADEKERAEHVMLVDLGRNDLGKVCNYGTVKVTELMVIERYSHVMHIVSDVRGQLAPDRNGLDLIRATFPAGTVSGAPKIRAMQIIDELETTRRGSYAGSVGFLSHSGDLDLCITLRTILIKNGTAYVQAGGGVVYDSDPEFEFNESRNKAKASLAAIELAQRGL